MLRQLRVQPCTARARLRSLAPTRSRCSMEATSTSKNELEQYDTRWKGYWTAEGGLQKGQVMMHVLLICLNSQHLFSVVAHAADVGCWQAIPAPQLPLQQRQFGRPWQAGAHTWMRVSTCMLQQPCLTTPACVPCCLLVSSASARPLQESAPCQLPGIITTAAGDRRIVTQPFADVPGVATMWWRMLAREPAMP
jgi:hypothetical protein